MEVPLSLKNPKNARKESANMKCLSDYSVEKEIGEGSFSTVYLAKTRNEEKQMVALKVCLKKLILNNKMVAYIHREKDALALLSEKRNSHPGIVTLYATFQDPESLYFVLEYAKYGDLLTVMQRQPNKRFTVDDSRYYAANLLDALAHIHKLGIIHRDVKAENLLLKEDGRILLTDFGSSKFLKDYEQERRTKPKKTSENSSEDDDPDSEVQPTERRSSFVGTAFFATPEMLNGVKMSPASDIWAFAVTLFLLLTGTYPFVDISEYLVFRRIQDLLFNFPADFVDDNAKELIERILVKDQKDRLTIEQIKEHIFFEHIDLGNLQEIEPPKVYANL